MDKHLDDICSLLGWDKPQEQTELSKELDNLPGIQEEIDEAAEFIKRSLNNPALG